jgi:hypothetical protein
LNDAYLGFRRHRRRSTEAGVMWRLGEFDDAEFWEIVAATEAPLEATDLFRVGSGDRVRLARAL